LRFSHREPRNRGEGEGQGWRGLIHFGPKSEASLWGRVGFINRRSPVSASCRTRVVFTELCAHTFCLFSWCSSQSKQHAPRKLSELVAASGFGRGHIHCVCVCVSQWDRNLSGIRRAPTKAGSGPPRGAADGLLGLLPVRREALRSGACRFPGMLRFL
jgi:hypothetical protein